MLGPDTKSNLQCLIDTVLTWCFLLVSAHCVVIGWDDHHDYLTWYLTDKAYRGLGIGSLVFKVGRHKCLNT